MSKVGTDKANLSSPKAAGSTHRDAGPEVRVTGEDLATIFSNQLSVFSKLIVEQLVALKGSQQNADAPDRLRTGPGIAEKPLQVLEPADRKPPKLAQVQSVTTPPACDLQPAKTASRPVFMPYRPIAPGEVGSLTSRQRQHCQTLFERYNAKTRASKETTQRYRRVFADNRASAGFRFSIKDVLYPIQGVGSRGSKITDIDGNEYVDLTMGFGVILFGHSAPFIVNALQRQLEQGIQLGPQSVVAGEVAEELCKMTGMERAAFCNSGTEAVMTAVRLARTRTGRSKLVIFSGSYHGFYDGMVARPVQDERDPHSVPMAPGITPGAVEDTLVLEYGSTRSLDVIRRYAGQIAAVLVEPIQSRRPDLQPREFLHELRKLATEDDFALILDEVITGFRIGPGGAQEWFGVKADIAIYGKILGGGMPIGVVAGRASYLDGIDGGFWNYGDTSYPKEETTFFAGTFCKHPLAMAAAQAVLRKLKQESATLYPALNQLTADLAVALNRYFAAEAIPIQIVHFGSLFRFSYKGNMDLLFYHLLLKGVYIWEGRNCFLSTAHTQEDVNRIIQAVKESVTQLRNAGFLPGPTPGHVQEIDQRDRAPELAAANPLVASPSAVTIGTEDTPAEFPLTEEQKHLWFLAEMSPEASAAYNLPVAVQLRGALRIPEFHLALESVVNRHQALRTRIADDGNTQIVSPRVPVELPIFDICEMDERQKDPDCRRWLQTESKLAFSLQQGPLFRARLLKLEPQVHVLLLVMHHIVSDGISIVILLRELQELYAAVCQGRESRLPSPVQFHEYQERQAALHAVAAADEQYWLKQFEVLPPALELPLDRPRPAVKAYEGAMQSAVIDKLSANAIRNFSGKSGCTLFMTLFAAFAELLHRLTGQDDLVVGISATGRSGEGGQTVVGYCTKLLPVRVRASASGTFRSFLQKNIRGTLLDAWTHENYSVSDLIRAVNPARDASRGAIVEVTFNLDKAPEQASLSDVQTRLVPVPVSYSKFDLSVNVTETASGLLVEAEYCTNLFHSATMERFLAFYARFLEHTSADPDMKMSEVQLLSNEERQQLLVQWNETAADVAQPYAHELFEEQARKTPEAVALSCAGRALTYAELDRRANQLGHYLVELGIAPESKVAVFMQRGEDMLVGLLAVMKAGGAYLPLDPEFPAERLNYMLEDAQAEVLLTHTAFSDRLPGHACKVVCVDADWNTIAGQRAGKLSVSLQPSNLAYVIYTSGSTGNPKAVLIQHGGMLNHLWAKVQDLHLTADDVIAQTASSSFDISIWQFLAGLLVGSKVQVLGDDIARDGGQLLQEASRLGITVLETVPTLLSVMLEHALQAPHKPVLATMRWMISNAEALPISLCQKWRDCYPQVPLLNAYGPTECSDDIAHFVVGQDQNEESRYAPLGRPLFNTQVYVLDEGMEPLPVAIAGELYIGGKGVGRGYLNRPELTAEKFVPDCFGGEAGKRLYRTGDRVRWRADGNLEFLERVDHQVKIRGNRVELGEIDAALRLFPGVQHCAIVVREAQPGEKHLVAYVVAEAGSGGRKEWREHLLGKLPEYMVPALYVAMEELPLNSNGKLDRRALPAPEWSSQEQEYTGPRNAIEEILCGIWGEVLQRERVGISENFFEIGGHSLLATQVMSRMRKVFRLELPLRVMFDAPTVEGLSGQVEKLQREGVTVAAAPLLVRKGRSDRLPLSYAQQRLWFIDQLDGGSAAYNLPYGVRLQGELDVEGAERSLREIVRRHEVLRTSFPMRDGEAVQEIAGQAEFELPVVDLRGSEERERILEGLLQAEARRPFDLARGPLVRGSVVRLEEQEQVLLVTMHHIAGDGWSVGILEREFGALYAAYREGKESPLAELPIQYADYAMWQREWLQGEVLEEQLGYWRGQLEGVGTLELPTDHPRPGMANNAGATVGFAWPAELTEKLKSVSRQEGVTLFMSLLAGLQWMLGRYSGQEDVAVGSVIANRNRAETEGLVGFFANTLVLRTDVSGDPSFRDLLRRVREVTLGAYAHQDVPFEKLVQDLDPTRDPSRTPFFQVMLALQNAPQSQLELPGLTVETVSSDFGQAKFDLTLVGWETEQGLQGALEYATALFDRTTVERLLRHYRRVLEQAVVDAGGKLSVAELLSGEEQQQLLVDWSGRERAYPQCCVHELFEEQVRKTPESVAVVYAGQQLSYRELNQRANRLGRYLRELGVGPEVRVGICVERSLEMIVGLLAILKAGGAYVPLDPEYPVERLAYMVEDARVPVLLAHRESLQFSPPQTTSVVYLDRDWTMFSGYSDENLLAVTHRDNLAYLIYTSGSTGRPKGVQIPHTAVTNFLAWGAFQLAIVPETVLLAVTSLSFDIAALELWLPLSVGAKVVIAPSETTVDADALWGLLISSRATVMQATPTTWRMLTYGTHSLPRQLLCLCGGESWEFSLAAKLMTSGCQVANLYGPTEATIWSTFFEVSPTTSRLSLGQPIANTQAYVLDQQMELALVGAAGELYIGGAGVGRGYLNQPEMTAGVFVPDPFSRESGRRLYRTGDRARWLANGNLEFLGRLDHQVKIRGYRIELGEIEAVLLQAPGVRHCAVTVREDKTGGQRLVGYVVAEPGMGDRKEWRRFVQGKLPEYMVPSVYVSLDQLPRTPNGKMDRRALPLPQEDQHEYLGPRTPTEAVVAGIWAEVLKRDRVGVDENFFDIGGHSLLATQVLSRIRSELHVDLPLRGLFERPTVANIAEQIAIAQEVARADHPKIARITQTGEERILSELDELSEDQLDKLIGQFSASSVSINQTQEPPQQNADDEIIHMFDAGLPKPNIVPTGRE